jgi:predicted transcriptional regulator of viral defense system
MSKSKYLNRIREVFEKSLVVDFKSIKRIIGKDKSNYSKLIIFNLIKKGEIHKISKGCYTKFTDPSLSVLCFKPSYLGLQSALSFYGLWGQETIPVVITSKKIRIGIRRVFNTNVLVRRINSKYFFGVNYEKDGKFYFPYSDIEKTFIDMVVFNEIISEEVLINFKKRINKKKLKNYLKKYPKKIQKKISKIL